MVRGRAEGRGGPRVRGGGHGPEEPCRRRRGARAGGRDGPAALRVRGHIGATRGHGVSVGAEAGRLDSAASRASVPARAVTAPGPPSDGLATPERPDGARSSSRPQAPAWLREIQGLLGVVAQFVLYGAVRDQVLTVAPDGDCLQIADDPVAACVPWLEDAGYELVLRLQP